MGPQPCAARPPPAAAVDAAADRKFIRPCHPLLPAGSPLQSCARDLCWRERTSGDGAPGGHPLISRFSGRSTAVSRLAPVSSTLRWRTLSLVNFGVWPKSMRCLSQLRSLGSPPCPTWAPRIIHPRPRALLGQLHLGVVQGVVVFLIDVADVYVAIAVSIYRVTDDLAVEAGEIVVALDSDLCSRCQDRTHDRRVVCCVEDESVLVLQWLIHQQAGVFAAILRLQVQLHSALDLHAAIREVEEHIVADEGSAIHYEIAFQAVNTPL